MPRKVFVAGEILTAADMNEYVGNQVVMTFAGTAARGSAIGTAVEGMVTYLEDTDSFEYWDGSAWEAVVPDFDLTTPVSGDSLVYDGTNWVNGPRSGNAIINGDFGIWQRGTTSGTVTTGTHFVADRFAGLPFGATVVYSQGSFSPADIEAIGYGDAQFYWRVASTGGATGGARTYYQVEDVRTFAGQTVTASFWARADSATTLRLSPRQYFGSGGSSTVSENQDFSLTTDWERYSVTFDFDSVSGKTIGSDSSVQLVWIKVEDAAITYDLWGVQLEAGPVATPFKLAGGGSKAAELALCQRYYHQISDSANSFLQFNEGAAVGTTAIRSTFNMPVTMRTSPSLTVTGTFDTTAGGIVLTPSLSAAVPSQAVLNFAGTGLTTYNAYGIRADADSTSKLEFDAEL